MPHPTTFERELGCYETLHAKLHDLAGGHGTIVGVVSIDGALKPHIIKQTLSLLHKQHPLLRAVRQCVANKYYFESSAEFTDIPFHVCYKKKSHLWKTIIEQELAKPLLVDKYLWGVQLILPTETSEYQSEIVVAFCHSICDGISLLGFLNDLLNSYTTLEQGVFPNISPLPLLPPVEQLLEHQPSSKDFCIPQNNTWPYLTTAPFTKRRTKNQYRILPLSQLLELTKKCQEQHVSVNAALNAAIALAACKQRDGAINIQLHTPINLRSYCKPVVANNHFGCYSSIMNTQHSISPDGNFWKLACNYRQQCKTEIHKANFLPTQFNLATLDQFIKNFCLNIRNHFSLGFGVTNAGQLRLTNKNEMQHKIKFIYGGTSRQAGDFVILLSAIMYGNQLFLTFSYTYPLLSDEWVNSFIDYFMESILASL